MLKGFCMKKCLFATLSVLALLFALALIPLWMQFSTRRDIYRSGKNIPARYTAIVPGARIYSSGKPSAILRDRLDKAIQLYQIGKVERILCSGDHGTKRYDELNSMKQYLLSKGVDSTDIFLDHAGFNSYNTIVRARRVFAVTDAIVVTQKYHLPRMLYIAKRSGITADGYIADKRYYPKINRFRKREVAARIKSFFEVHLKLKPRFLGDPIPIHGSSRKSCD